MKIKTPIIPSISSTNDKNRTQFQNKIETNISQTVLSIDTQKKSVALSNSVVMTNI